MLKNVDENKTWLEAIMFSMSKLYYERQAPVESSPVSLDFASFMNHDKWVTLGWIVILSRNRISPKR